MSKGSADRKGASQLACEAPITLGRRPLLLGLASALLVACAPARVRRDTVARRAVGQELAARALTAFRLQGRVALSDGDQGGSGRLIWEQRGLELDVRFSAPVSQRTWRLQRDLRGARLTDDRGQVHEHADLQYLLDQVWAVGVPVEALSYWLRGSRLPGDGRVSLDESGRLQQLQQGGWTVDYLRWQDAQAGFPALPGKLYASSGQRWVRVVVQRWQLPDA